MTNNQVAEKKNAFVTKVAEKIQDMVQQGQINMPEGYSAVNALQAAYFTLTAVDFGKNKSLIEQATSESVAFALQDMAIQGLSVAKKQGYFIVYGDKLQFQRSYHGTQAVVKRMEGVKDLWANVIWKGEEFEVEYNQRGQLAFKSHKVDWKAATGKKEDIEGAYCIIEKEDGTQLVTVMTQAEIFTAWSTSRNKSVQDKYPQEMAKRTVFNRAAKAILNTSDDSDVLVDAINRSTESEFDNRKDMGEIEEVKQEIAQHANSDEVIDFDTSEPVQAEFVEPVKKKEKGQVQAEPELEQADIFESAEEPF